MDIDAARISAPWSIGAALVLEQIIRISAGPTAPSSSATTIARVLREVHDPPSRAVAGLLVGTGAVSFRTSPFFTFTSGVESPVYVDNRRLLGFVPERRAIVDELARRAGELEPMPDVIAGTATAGIPWAAWLSDTLGLPMLYVRSQAKAWGHGRAVEGSAPEGARVLLVEDLAFTGGSLVAGIENLVASGYTVTKSLTIVTYALPATRRRFEQLRVPHGSLTTIDAALDAAADSGALGPSETKIVDRWLEEQRRR